MSNPIIATMSFTRPTTDTLFAPAFTTGDVTTFQKYIDDTYVSPGKMLSRMFTTSADTLTRKVMTVWKNDEERTAYINDTNVSERLQLVLDHCRNNNVTVFWTNQEVEDGIIVREWSGYFVGGA